VRLPQKLNAKLGPINTLQSQLHKAENDRDFAEKLAKQDELREQRKREQEEEAAARAAEMAGGMGGMPGGGMPGGGMPGGGMPGGMGGMGGMAGMMNDPDIMAAMSNPKVHRLSTSHLPVMR